MSLQLEMDKDAFNANQAQPALLAVDGNAHMPLTLVREGQRNEQDLLIWCTDAAYQAVSQRRI